MKIKLRLYARDLDLIILKQHRQFNLTATIRQALCEYVATGMCNRVHVPDLYNQQITQKNEVVDVTFNEDHHQRVIEWILSLKPGLRSAAIKTIVRSAIENPIITPYLSENNLLIQDTSETNHQTCKAKERVETKRVPEENAKTATEISTTPAPSPWDAPRPSNHGAEDDDELDLLEIDFENY